MFNKEYTFDNYVAGEDNSFPFMAAKAIARNPGIAYNPFTISGKAGMGKTHLMQAIGNFICENSDRTVIYITAENFSDELINAIKEGTVSTFKNKYRHVDMLLVDGIHFLQKMPMTQQELFFTFEALYSAKKQVVFTSDRPIHEMGKKFRRFERGLNVDIELPNYETRYAILKKKMENKKINIPDEVISLIGENVSTNVLVLETALTKVIAYAELTGEPVTIETTQKVLENFFIPIN
jgi:chromosomal replication initiator protein